MTRLLIGINLGPGELCVPFSVFVSLWACMCRREEGRDTHMQREIKKCVFINEEVSEGSVLMFLCPTSCMHLNYDKEYCISSWVVNRFRIYLSRWWKRMAETGGWRVRKLRTSVQLVQYTRSPPWCRSLAEIIRCNHLILVAHNSGRSPPTTPSSRLCIYSRQGTNSKASRTKSHLCICRLHPKLVSSNTSVIPAERTHRQLQEP